MRAIPILGPAWTELARGSRLALLTLALMLNAPFSAFTQETPTPFQRILAIYEMAKKSYLATPDNVEVSWKFGRACFECADFVRENSRRAAFAEEGIAACRKAAAQDPKSAPARYYLALNLGQLARTRTLGALKLVDEMEELLLEAIKLEPAFDNAGPHRSLGLLYREAPGWPISVGSESKARHHLEQAVALSPVYPDSHLGLMEGYLEWGDKKAARAHRPKVEATLAKAREALTGPEWEESWKEWDRRWESIKKKL